jgi:hypothetical protein
MYKPSTYLKFVYFPTSLPTYETYFLLNWLTRWNQIINFVKVHPQLSNNEHLVGGVLVGASSLWPHVLTLDFIIDLNKPYWQSMSLALRSSFPWSPSYSSLRSYFDKNLLLKPICDWQMKNHNLIGANIEDIQSQVHPWWHGLKT